MATPTAGGAPLPTVATQNCLGVPDMPIYDSPHMESKDQWTPTSVALFGSILTARLLTDQRLADAALAGAGAVAYAYPVR